MLVFRAEVKEQIAGELARGEQARAQGFEGRARVCARRAAGYAAREFLALGGQAVEGMSAYDLLAHLRDREDLQPEIRRAAGRLLERVNEAFELSGDADLLTEARWLADTLERVWRGNL